MPVLTPEWVWAIGIVDTMGVADDEARSSSGLTDEEKRMICAQARGEAVSLSKAVRRFDVNANLVFTWLRDPRFA